MPQQYATVTDMETAFSNAELVFLSNLDGGYIAGGAAGTVNEEKIDRALIQASARINPYLQSRYSLPLDSIPEVLNQCCCDLARSILEKNQERAETIDRRKEWLTFLRDLAAGRVSLGLDSTDAVVIEDPAIGPEVVADDRTFTSSSLQEFIRSTFY
jgi:phage gp36-like protein